MRRSLAAVLAAAFALALGGAALAGNGNGHGNDGSAPGNSGNAPGQMKKQEPAQPASQQEQSQAQTQTQASAQAQASTQQQTTTTTQGVKPSSDTAKDTHERADSGKTKLYGNGKTAGGIAMSRGASGSTMLHGPGNSQPHKVTACGHRHEVDVHAIKSYSDAACAAKTAPTAKAKSTVKAAPKPRSKHVETPAVKPVLPAQQPRPAAKVWICHATGSATNPYVLIHVSANAEAAHTAHQGGRDIVLGASMGSCPAPKPPVQPKTPPPVQAPPPATLTPPAPPTPPMPGQPTPPPPVQTPPPAPTPAPPAPPAVTGGVAPLTASTAKPAAVAAAPKPRGSVLGAEATLRPKQQPGSGVLGSLASRTLPFTGIELWIVALVAGALVAGGFALRRAGRGTA